ncbi:MAG: Helix-turn-helix transcriptional regulator [Acidimicrobiales bacterium]|nr:Helix-turn-helix transcriptional regulator [Acidimicrobiales bacterium]
MGVAERPRVAVVNDFEVVVAGLAAILEPFSDRIDVVGAILMDEPIEGQVDIALYDTAGHAEPIEDQLAKLLSRPEVDRVAIYSFDFNDSDIRTALDAGAAGYLSKAAPAKELVDQLELLANGEQVVAEGSRAEEPSSDDQAWPGRDLGLSERESEVVALAALGRRNADIAEALFVSVDTVKTHLARSFRKLGVHNRTELSALIHRRPSFRRMLPSQD